MELVKKILVSILTIVGIALAGLIICAGVLVVFPNTKIFGISYINTASQKAEEKVIEEINMNNLADDYNIDILAGNYNVELCQAGKNIHHVYVNFLNNVIGFTRELDSNKKAKLDYSYNDSSRTLSLKVTEPDGLFLKRDTTLKVSLPEEFLNKKINIISTTNKGVTTFGTSETPIKVNNVTVSCLSASGGVKLQNAKIDGDLNIKNILGRIEVTNDINGKVTIDSTVGTYTFGKINNLAVVSAEEGKTNNPAITLDECQNVDWNAESGSFIVKKFIKGNLNVKTYNANFSIAKTLKMVDIQGESSNVTIDQIGNFVENPLSEENSFNWAYTHNGFDGCITIENEKDGNINIGRSYFKLSLTTPKGKIVVNNAMKEIFAETKSGSISVNFVDSDNYKTDTKLDEFIKNYFIAYLDGEETTKNYKNIDSLKVKTENGAVNVTNIRNSIDIGSTAGSPITLTYKYVRNNSKVSTSSKKVDIKAPIGDFVLKAMMDQKSNAKIYVNFAQLVVDTQMAKLESSMLPDTDRMVVGQEDNLKYLEVKVSNAKDNSIGLITVINTTGAISATAI